MMTARRRGVRVRFNMGRISLVGMAHRLGLPQPASVMISGSPKRHGFLGGWGLRHPPEAGDPWLIYMLRGIEETAIWTTKKIAAIRILADDTLGFVRSRLPKIYSRELVDVVFDQTAGRERLFIHPRLLTLLTSDTHEFAPYE
jgi:hypothetical protein